MTSEDRVVGAGSSPNDKAADSKHLEPLPVEGLDAFYRDVEDARLIPLWTEIGDLMPLTPRSHAVPHRWEWRHLHRIAERAGALIPVGRGGERRAIALANPGLKGAPYATSTLWAAIQYLNAGENAPVHRHSQHAFRFIVEGEGVATIVNGDPVPMRRGDFLPQGGWNWHSHVNESEHPMAWIDGLDIPLQRQLDTTFFEPGLASDNGGDDITVPHGPSRSERLWGQPGVRPLSKGGGWVGNPLLAYRWEATDAALAEQLALEDEGFDATVGDGHAAIRFTNPLTGGDALPTIRAEFHRLRAGAGTADAREAGSSVFQVFSGNGTAKVGDRTWTVDRGDLFVVPSWELLSISTEEGVDLFRFSDSPVIEVLGLAHGPLWNVY